MDSEIKDGSGKPLFAPTTERSDRKRPRGSCPRRSALQWRGSMAGHARLSVSAGAIMSESDPAKGRCSAGARQRRSRRRRWRAAACRDVVFAQLTRGAAIAVLVDSGRRHRCPWSRLAAGASRSSVSASSPTEVWNPVTEQFGALAPIYGTLVTSVIAMLIAVPVGLGIAFFLTELCPQALRRPIAIAIELLAGIPTIIYGIWGLFFFAPFLQQYVQPFLIEHARPRVRCSARCSQGPPYGIGMLTAGLILAIMVLPFITSISRDVFETVPPVLKESAYGVGCTTWEVVKNVVLPYTRVGVIGGVMLAWAAPSARRWR